MEKNIIEVKNLVKKFKDFVAVDNITFNVRNEEIFAFLGPNGAGKSTTIKILTTLLSPTSGEININGYDLIRNQDSVRKSFGIVFQDPSLDDDMTALENMEFHAALYKIPKKYRKERIKELLNFVELWERKDSLVKTFSGGMKRRLEIARGLLHHPKILFLDEPTLGLDPQTRNHVWQYVINLSKTHKMTVFFTTHYMEEAEKIAQRIAIIDHGKIVSVGTSKEVKENTGANSLEDAFLKLTGNIIRDQEATGIERMRQHRKMWRGAR
jgi:ABC-2 type transport system ATP-binding protein